MKMMIIICFDVNPAADSKSVIFNWRWRHITLPPFISGHVICLYLKKKFLPSWRGRGRTMTSLWRHIYRVSMRGKMGNFFPRSVRPRDHLEPKIGLRKACFQSTTNINKPIKECNTNIGSLWLSTTHPKETEMDLRLLNVLNQENPILMVGACPRV